MKAWLTVSALLACLLQGCGGDGLTRVPIEGILTAGGSPIPGAVVQLLPSGGTAGPGAIGMSDEQGKFEVISSRESHEGVPPGEYVVRVSKLINPDGSPVPVDAAEADYPQCREAIPRPYSGLSSPLKVTISEQGGEVKVDIPKPLLEYKKARKTGV